MGPNYSPHAVIVICYFVFRLLFREFNNHLRPWLRAYSRTHQNHYIDYLDNLVFYKDKNKKEKSTHFQDNTGKYATLGNSMTTAIDGRAKTSIQNFGIRDFKTQKKRLYKALFCICRDCQLSIDYRTFTFRVTFSTRRI